MFSTGGGIRFTPDFLHLRFFKTPIRLTVQQLFQQENSWKSHVWKIKQWN